MVEFAKIIWSLMIILIGVKLGRNSIGVDINPEYVKIGEKRLLEILGE
jgi:DNA modification methylase|tara:strand:- start:291 stop:434 length:144 start_codon:yes stop_codon:yes gene_type:complete